MTTCKEKHIKNEMSRVHNKGCVGDRERKLERKSFYHLKLIN